MFRPYFRKLGKCLPRIERAVFYLPVTPNYLHKRVFLTFFVKRIFLRKRPMMYEKKKQQNDNFYY